MKTLYISDLDGTLLRSDQKISPFTSQTIHDLVEQGMLFSFATARSYITAKKVTGELDARIPVVVYNGAMVVEHMDGTILLNNFFHEDVQEILSDLFEHDIYPLVYAMVDGVEKMSYIQEKNSPGLQRFLDTRKGDIRLRPVGTVEELRYGDIFYFSCMDEMEKLKPFYEKYKENYQCILQLDLYTKDPWLEVLPKGTSKANAIKQLVEYFNCGKVVAFGDGVNDIEMFRMADEAYAVENAVPELKAIATGIIGGNNDDSVAKWLAENFKAE